jgi:ubiquinone/menaquinone biosynthesis C-methylase UbiE
MATFARQPRECQKGDAMDLDAPDSEMSDKIKQYWEDRARETEPTSVQATTYDVYLREHEIRTLRARLEAIALPAGSTVVDLGCGDGFATVSLAAAFPTLRFIGVDWSAEMLAIAEHRLSEAPALRSTVEFRQGDMRDVQASLGSERFQAFTTMRSLINLTSSEQQYATIAQIADHLVPGGYYFCVENFVGGQESFNRMRVAMGLPEIPVRWHNLFFDEARFVEETRAVFDSVTFDNFLSSYYLATRVIYSAACHLVGEEPDYLHPIHQVAWRLPEIGDFCPIKLVTMRRKL